MTQRHFVSLCTCIFVFFVFVFAPCPAQQAHADTVDLLNWYSTRVYDGQLSAGFAVVPGFEDQLIGARLYDSDNNLLTEFDLQADHYDDRSKCSGGTYWWETIGSNFDDGTYVLELDFQAKEAITTYTTDISTTSLEPFVTNLDAQVHDDGSITFSWDVEHDISSGDPFYYQVRIYNEDQEKCTQVSSYQLNGSRYTSDIPAGYMRCLVLNETCSWQVRVFVPDSDNVYRFRSSTPLTYDPEHLENRIMWFGGFYFNGSQYLGFDVRPGSRENVVDAQVTTPVETPIYTFNLDQDWIDLSTATRLNTQWWKERPGLEDGEYIFEATFADGHTETASAVLETSTDLKPVDMETMATELDGQSIHISFDSPADAPPQEYDLRIRNVDGTKEYFRSNKNDVPHFTFNPFRLRALYPYNDVLEPGNGYVLLVRSYDPEDGSVMQDSQHKRFVYDPLGEIIRQPACISPVMNILLDDT